MKKISVLIPISNQPYEQNKTMRIYNNILEKLKENKILKINWVIFQSKKLETYGGKESVIDFHDYNDALELLEITKPDIILFFGWMKFSYCSLKLAANFKHIPIVVIFDFDMNTFKHYTKNFIIKKRIRLLFSSKMFGETQNEDKAMKFGNFFFMLNEYKFFIKTIRRVIKNKIKQIDFVICTPIALLIKIVPPAKFITGDLNMYFVPDVLKMLTKSGHDKSKLFLIGNPNFDDIYKKISGIIQNKVTNSNNTRILLCTTSQHEAGVLTKEKEDHIIITAIKKILENKNLEISLKIHPSNTLKSEYEELLKKNNLHIPLYQKEDLIELSKDFDLMITYGLSTVGTYGVLLKKPVIYLNFLADDVEPYGHDEKITIVCNKINELSEKIQRAKQMKITKQDFDEYLVKFFWNI